MEYLMAGGFALVAILSFTVAVERDEPFHFLIALGSIGMAIYMVLG